MKRATFSILFFVKKSRKAADGQTPIFVRVTIDGVRCESTLNMRTNPEKWNSSLGKSEGKDKASLETNKRLDLIRVRLMEVYREIELQGEEPNASDVIDRYFGRVASQAFSLINLFKEHNEKCKALSLRGELSAATVERYNTCLDHTVGFLKYEYKQEDFNIKKIDLSFIENFEFYLKTKRKCNHNTTMKYLKNFRKIILIAIKQKAITSDPFVGFKMTLKKVDRVFLEERELNKLIAKDFEKIGRAHV